MIFMFVSSEVFISLVVLSLILGMCAWGLIASIARDYSDRKVDRHDDRCRAENIWIGTVLADCSCRCCREGLKTHMADPRQRELYEKMKATYDKREDPNEDSLRMPIC